MTPHAPGSRGRAVDYAGNAHQERYRSHSSPPGCVRERSADSPVLWHSARANPIPQPRGGRQGTGSLRAWQKQSLALHGCACTGGSCAGGLRHGEARVGAGSCFVATPWFRERGILAAPGTFAVSLCWHCIPGWEQSPAGLHILLAVGWGGLGGHPGAALALLAVGVGQALSRLLSALHTREVPRPGEGASEPAQPRGRHPHPGGGQSRSARLCRLWVCSESPPALLFPGLRAPGSHPQASRALLPGLQQRAGGAQSISRARESLLHLLAVPQPGQHGCACPGHSCALQKG